MDQNVFVGHYKALKPSHQVGSYHNSNELVTTTTTTTATASAALSSGILSFCQDF
jgi:hypothetical protein